MGMSHHLVNILTPTELYTLKVSFMACELYLSKTNKRKKDRRPTSQLCDPGQAAQLL